MKNDGFITLEIMIAMLIMIATFSSVVFVSFGSQEIVVSSAINDLLSNKTNQMIDEYTSLARKDFKLIFSTTTSEMIDNLIFKNTVLVDMNSDIFTKKIVAKSVVKVDEKTYESTVTALVSDGENTDGKDTCDTDLASDWKSPSILNTASDVTQLVSDPSGIYTITNVDAYKNKLYIAINNQNTNNKPTLLVFDTSNKMSPSVMRKIDNSSVSAGINAIHATDNYIYLANGYGAPFTTCAESNSCAQLQIVDQKNLSQPIYNFKIPSVTGSGGQSVGKSIFYQNGYVYLGLAKTLSGPEFNIIDVRNFPNSPPVWVGGNSVNGSVNAIEIKGNYAYLATADSEELKIIDITDKSHPVLVGGFNSPTGAGNGKSFFMLGDKIYLGKTFPNAGNDFHILNNVIHSTSLTEIGGLDIGSSVNSIFVKNYLAFLFETNNKLEILDVSNPKQIKATAPAISLGADKNGITMDCEMGAFFIGSNDSENRGFIYVLNDDT